MNDLITQNNPLSGFVKRPKLTGGQKSLYKLVCDANEKRIEKITKNMLFDIYKSIATGTSEVGGYKTFNGQWIPWRDEPWTKEQWNANFFQWFKSTLGALIVKGYCVILPTIDFRDIDENCIKEKNAC